MQRLERRLAAVLAIDTAGYSRMMEADVEGTHRRIIGLMIGIIEPAIAAGGGRIVKKTGDGALVEFPSVSEALRAAMLIQCEAGQAEASQPPDRQLRFRIGINLGDIIVEPDDIYGDGVNIAARLEGLAQPGDVIVSESAMQTVDRAAYAFIDMGVHRLKNISRPVRTFRVLLSEDAGGRLAPGSAIGTLVPGFGTRPAIAVLPFRYTGPDPAEHEYFADGVTEDIISALSRWRFFPVIARGSVFTFKGRDVDPVVVGQQLGARYILEGRLRRQDSRIRSGVSLVDADSRETLLSEQYQYELHDMFAMQDEIVRTSLGVLEPELLKREHQRALRTPPQSANAYELFLRGQWHHYRYTREDNAEARAFFRRALDIAPVYALAAANLAMASGHAAHVGWGDREQLYDEALMHARNALRIDGLDPMAHHALGSLLLNTASSPGEAADLLRQAVHLDPSYAAAHALLAFAYNYTNRPDQALPEIELALRLSPQDPRRFLWLPALTISHYLAGRYRDALAAAQETLRLRPDYPVPLRYLLATFGQLGRTKEAQAVLPLVRRLDNGMAGTEAYLRRLFQDPPLDRILDGLRKAGLS